MEYSITGAPGDPLSRSYAQMERAVRVWFEVGDIVPPPSITCLRNSCHLEGKLTLSSQQEGNTV